MLQLNLNHILGGFLRELKAAAFTVLLAGGLCGSAFAFNFSEHRTLGDSAFSEFMNGLVSSGEFKTRQEVCDFFLSTAGIQCPLDGGAPYFTELSNPPNYVSFGVINGLSGDHEDNPLQLREELMHRYSKMNQMIALNARKNAQFSDRPTYSEITAVNPAYPYLAIRNYAHFYNYGDTLDEHLGRVERENLQQLRSPVNGKKVFYNLDHSNALDIYTTLHIMAVDLAEKAGYLASTDPQRSRIYLSYAFLYEGFCGHFLEDSFASGHIIVRRSLLGGAINNKSLHDFYNTLGLTVMNLNGDIWKTYGDNTLMLIPGQWEGAKSYADIAVSTNPVHAVMARRAVRVSLDEVWSAYRSHLDGAPYTRMSDRFPDTSDNDEKEKFALDNFKALHYVPVPFGTDLSRYPLPVDKLDQLKEANAPPQNRNFIRSRVANTVTAMLGSYHEGSDGDTQAVLGLRLNVMNKANYHDMADKSGTVDSWSGYTASYFSGVNSKFTPVVSQAAVGKSFFWDIWVSKRRYFSIYSYLEAGASREDGVTHLSLSPSIGIQPGSLIGLDNYTLPRWIWTPMQFILPLKVTFGASFVPGRAPGYTCVGEIDLLF